jgi:hypothetical protein
MQLSLDRVKDKYPEDAADWNQPWLAASHRAAAVRF